MMEYSISIDGFEGKDIKAEYYFWSKPKLFINGEPVYSVNKGNEMILQSDDGKQVSASWNSSFINLAPQLIVNDKIITWIKPLKWYELLWCGLPICLACAFWTSSITGILGLPINIRIFRTQPNVFMKYFISGVISFLINIILPILLYILFTALTGYDTK